MRNLRTLFLGAVLAALGACAGSAASTGEDVLLTIATATARPNTEVQVSLTNLSGETVGHGVLPCTASWERREGDTWVTADEPRVCILPLLILRNGKTTKFTVATLGEGTYRLVTGGSWEDRHGEFTEIFAVRSNSITVK